MYRDRRNGRKRLDGVQLSFDFAKKAGQRNSDSASFLWTNKIEDNIAMCRRQKSHVRHENGQDPNYELDKKSWKNGTRSN